MIAPERTRLNEDELNQAWAARASTVVPLSAYDGSYEKPILLIGRELDLSEVELVSGPWPECGALQYLRANSDPRITEEITRGIDALRDMQTVFNRNDPELQSVGERYEQAVRALVAILERDAVLMEVLRSRLRKNVRPNRDLVDRLLSAAQEAERYELLCA